MAIEVFWEDDQKTLLTMQFANRWSIDEIQVATRTVYDMGQQEAHPVYVIMDMAGTSHLPSGITSLRGFALDHRLPNLALLVIITDSSFLRIMANTFVRLTFGPNVIKIAANREIADTMIMAHKSLAE